MSVSPALLLKENCVPCQRVLEFVSKNNLNVAIQFVDGDEVLLSKFDRFPVLFVPGLKTIVGDEGIIRWLEEHYLQ